MSRFFSLTALVLAASLAALPLQAAESRSASLDVVLLVDKSLSMAGAEAEAKRYIAGEVLGPLLMPGDRLIIEAFYGKVDRLYAGTIRSDEDKAAAIRLVAGIVADGRFTDIGSALDVAAKDLAELGAPERAKYVLLITDERQEAPLGSKYYSPDFKVVHPALTYTKRVEKAGFRVITVGFGVAARVDAATADVMRLLSDPPTRKRADYPELAANTDPGLSGALAVQPNKVKGGKEAGGMQIITLVLIGAAVLLAVFLAIAITRVVHLRKTRRKDAERDDPD